MTKIQVRYLKNFFERSKGLIWQEKLFPVMFHTRFGIHTFGMKHPIDVLVLNHNKIVKFQKSLKPNNVFFWNPKYNSVLELPAGTISKLEVKVGETIELVVS